MSRPTQQATGRAPYCHFARERGDLQRTRVVGPAFAAIINRSDSIDYDRRRERNDLLISNEQFVVIGLEALIDIDFSRAGVR